MKENSLNVSKQGILLLPLFQNKYSDLFMSKLKLIFCK